MEYNGGRINMIKECPILINNAIATVVKYDNIEIQFPKVQENTKTVFVKFDNGKYTIVNSQEYQKEIAKEMANKTADKKETKKTTKKGSSPKEDVIVDNVAEQSET